MTEHIRINDVAPRIHYGANGVQCAFTYPFAIFKASELEVWLNDVRQSAGFTVSGAGVSSGGSVLFAVPPAAGTRVILRRRLALERVSDYQADGIIRAKTLNDELDYQVAAVQQVAEDVSRCIQRPFTSGGTASLALPEPAAGKALGWNADGSALVNDPADFAATVATVTAQAAQTASDVAKARTDRLAADAAAATTAADRTATSADRMAVHADRVAADADAAATAADRAAVAAHATSVATNSATAQTCRDQAEAASTTAVAAKDAAAASASSAAQSAATAVASSTAAASSATQAQTYASQAQAAASSAAVKISASDTVADYLGNSLTAGSNIALGVDNAGANEKLRISVTGLGTLAAKNSVGLADTSGLPTATVVGRSTAGSGAMEALTLGSGLSLSAGVLSCTVSPIDQAARDQTALANLRLILNTAVASGALSQGYQWEMASDEWASGSSNYLWVAGAPAYYTNTALAYSYGNPGGSGARSGWLGVSYGGAWINIGSVSGLVDGGTGDGPLSTPKIATGEILGCYLTFDFGSQVRMNGHRIYADGVSAGGRGSWVWQGSNDNANFVTAATCNWSNSGTGWQTFSYGDIGAYRYWRWYCVERPSDWSGNNTNNWVREFEFAIGATSGNTSMTLLSPVASVASQPAAVNAYFLWRDDTGSALWGTDLMVDLSRDGGTTWSAGVFTLIAVLDGSYCAVKVRAVVSGQPAGTSLRARVRTTTSKRQRVGALALYAE